MADSTNLPLIRLTAIRQDYNQRCVLDLESLDIFPGEILAIVGPSGAGKSTLLRLLNFLELPSSGSVHYKGSPIQPGSAASLEIRRRITMVFQRPLMFDRTVWENVAYGLRLRKASAIKEKVQSSLEQVGMVKFAHQRARQLSGGEAQRIALARAMVLHPEMLLLDEPTANLDPYNISAIEQIIRDLNAREKTTIVLVTHHIFQARRLAQRVALLVDGRLVEISTAERFFNNPIDPRTKAFVNGEMVY